MLKKSLGARHTSAAKPHLSLHPVARAAVATLAVAAASWSPNAMAQNGTTAVEADTVLTGVVVTSERREENIQDVPAPVTAISGSAIQGQKILLSTDVARLAPSLSGQGASNTGKPRWFMRGIGSNDPNATIESPIAIYVDDIVVGLTRLQSFPLFDLERVEVAEGPQGTLWGKNDTGGAINYIAKKPSFESESSGAITLAQYGTTTLQGAINLPLQEGVLATRLSLLQNASTGYATNLLTGQTGPQVSDVNARLQFLANITPDLDAHLILGLRQISGSNAPSYSVGGRNAAGSAVTIQNPNGIITQGQTAAQIAAGGGYVPPYGTDPNATSDFWAGASNTAESRNSATLKINYQLGRNTLTSTTGTTLGSGTSLTGVGVPLNTTLAQQSTSAGNRFNQFTEEVRLTSPKDQDLSWIVGAYYYNLNAGEDTATARFANGASTTVSTNRNSYTSATWNQTSTSQALFGNLRYQFTEKAAVGAGLRYTHETKSITESAVSLSNTAANTGVVNFASQNAWYLPGGVVGNVKPLTLSAEDSWDNATFDITPEYRFNKDLLGYVRFATGFRSGGFNQTITQPAGGTPYINRLVPETIANIEAGIKSAWLNNRVTLNASAFYYEVKNLQLNIQQAVTDANGNVVTSSSGQSNGKVSGLELETAAQVSSNWHVGSSLALLHSEYTDFNYQVGTVALNASGNEFYRAPNVQFRLDTSYGIALNNGSKVLLGTDWAYTSHYFHNATVQNDPIQETPSIWIGNLTATYRPANDKWSVNFFVNNVTANSTPYLSQIVNSTNGSYPVSVGSPRLVGVSLSFKT